MSAPTAKMSAEVELPNGDLLSLTWVTAPSITGHMEWTYDRATEELQRAAHQSMLRHPVRPDGTLTE